jgi:hypothetical protein
MNTESERMWKDATVAQSNVLSMNVCDASEENHEETE